LFDGDNGKLPLHYLYAAKFAQHGCWSRIPGKALHYFDMVPAQWKYCRIVVQ
jgi:hypothetical protein